MFGRKDLSIASSRRDGDMVRSEIKKGFDKFKAQALERERERERDLT